MPTTFPGTAIEISTIEKGSSRTLFDGIFATGGITLSQLSVMTGLEPYMIQNWVKRGFVSPPVKRVYTKQQFARIVIINMLKESLHIEHICEFIEMIRGRPNNGSDDLISDDELYHRYVDMLGESEVMPTDKASVKAASSFAAEGFVGSIPNSKERLERILQVMFYAHAASCFRKSAEEMFSTLQ